MRLDVEDHRSLRTGFLRNARRDPAAPALVVGGVTRTYGEMEETARRWCAAILARAERPPERIGLLAARSEVAYTGTLAALFAGAAFVPLNRRFPPERNHAMARQADLDAIIVDRGSAGQLAAVLQGLGRAPL
ncbi:MAG TPA: AMP-binding protein, partial [Gemmatimonadaceae bacterium]|nr:AMP-binding protein [Gemmatimonadaceae bacterium]